MAINIREELTKNAQETNIFGGRRFLGFTPKSSPVWVSYTAYDGDYRAGYFRITH